ncbi:MAG: phosphohydrolase [Clostridiales bacterium]|nr:phosphohydrolase [Clostridiales bacterium]
MNIFAIGDLHLPGGDQKPMNIFGAHWEGHFDKIRADWESRVGEDDVVLLPGDLSWAMQLESAMPDLEMVGALPGRKIILRGNHDYWWCGINHLREVLPRGMYALQNDAMSLCGVTFCGSRGWTLPQSSEGEDHRIYTRELIRMEMSLERAKKLGNSRLVMMTHYPPLDEKHRDTPVSELAMKYGVTDIVYGHLHGASLRGAFSGERGGIRYYCVSCDGLDFKLCRLSGDELAESGDQVAQEGV